MAGDISTLLAQLQANAPRALPAAPTPLAIGTGYSALTPLVDRAIPMGSTYSNMAGVTGAGAYSQFNPGAVPRPTPTSFTPSALSSGTPGGRLATLTSQGVNAGVIGEDAAAASKFFRLPASGVMGNIKAIGKANAIPLIAGLAGNKIGHAVGGKSGAAISGASQGGMLGATAGSVIPGLGTAIGAASGAAIGGALGYLGGKNKVNPETQLQSVIQTLGLDDADASQLNTLYAAYKASGKKSSEAAAAVGEIAVQLAQENAQAKQQHAVGLQAQAMYQSFFAPINKQMMDSADQRYQMIQSLIPQLPEGYRAVATAQAQSSLDNARRMTNAYAAQSMILPKIDAIKQQQAQQAQVAQQLAAQSIAAQVQGGAGASGGTLQDYLKTQGF